MPGVAVKVMVEVGVLGFVGVEVLGFVEVDQVVVPDWVLESVSEMDRLVIPMFLF